jgi:hypothetical protein
MCISHFQVVGGQGFNAVRYLRYLDHALRFARQQQFATLLQQNSITPTFGCFKRMTLCGRQVRTIFQPNVHHAPGLHRRDHNVGNRLERQVLALSLPLALGQYLVAYFKTGYGFERSLTLLVQRMDEGVGMFKVCARPCPRKKYLRGGK